MSRLSNRRVGLGILAGGLSATLFTRWPRAKPLAQSARAWPLAPAVPAAGQADVPAGFAAALDGVLQELAAKAPLRGVALDVELADTLAHFDVAMGEFAGHSEPQIEAVARACVRDLLDDAGDAHEIRWQLQSDERHLLICAVPLALVAELRAGALRNGLRLQRLRPQFPVRWNDHHRLLRSGLGVFASGHDDHAVIAFVRDGVVQALSVGSCTAELSDPQAAAPSVDRLLNNLGLGKTATPTRLDAQVDRLIAGLGVDVSQLARFVAVDDGDHGQALSSRWMFCNSDEVRT